MVRLRDSLRLQKATTLPGRNTAPMIRRTWAGIISSQPSTIKFLHLPLCRRRSSSISIQLLLHNSRTHLLPRRGIPARHCTRRIHPRARSHHPCPKESHPARSAAAAGQRSCTCDRAARGPSWNDGRSRMLRRRTTPIRRTGWASSMPCRRRPGSGIRSGRGASPCPRIRTRGSRRGGRRTRCFSERDRRRTMTIPARGRRCLRRICQLEAVLRARRPRDPARLRVLPPGAAVCLIGMRGRSSTRR